MRPSLPLRWIAVARAIISGYSAPHNVSLRQEVVS